MTQLEQEYPPGKQLPYRVLKDPLRKIHRGHWQPNIDKINSFSNATLMIQQLESIRFFKTIVALLHKDI